MTLVKHELKQGKISFLIWTISIGFLMAICIFLFPEMKGQMESVNDVFASMGSFTEAFGMDRLNFGTLTGFYAVECGIFIISERLRLSAQRIRFLHLHSPLSYLQSPSVILSKFSL